MQSWIQAGYGLKQFASDILYQKVWLQTVAGLKHLRTTDPFQLLKGSITEWSCPEALSLTAPL